MSHTIYSALPSPSPILSVWYLPLLSGMVCLSVCMCRRWICKSFHRARHGQVDLCQYIRSATVHSQCRYLYKWLFLCTGNRGVSQTRQRHATTGLGFYPFIITFLKRVIHNRLPSLEWPSTTLQGRRCCPNRQLPLFLFVRSVCLRVLSGSCCSAEPGNALNSHCL